MDDLRTRISEAAQELFRSEGLEGVSMRKVAERVGITAPAIYRHYRDKDELLHEIISIGLKILEDYLEPALQADRPYERLRRLIDRYLDFAIEQPQYFEFAFLVPSRNIHRIAEELQERNWPTFRRAVEQVALCMEQGVFRRDDPLETSILIWATSHGLVSLYRMERFGSDAEAFRAIYGRIVDRTLAALGPGTQLGSAGGSAGALSPSGSASPAGSEPGCPSSGGGGGGAAGKSSLV
jgi:AcrR family transcriptional regulator